MTRTHSFPLSSIVFLIVASTLPISTSTSTFPKASQSIEIPKNSRKQGRIYPRHLGKLSYWPQKSQKLVVEHACRLQMDERESFYLCVPMKAEVRMPRQAAPGALGGEIQAPKKRVIALDPGVRTFLTGYDPSGAFVEIGKGGMTRIFRLCLHLDKLCATIAKATSKKRKKSLEKAAARMRQRIRNLVDDLQKKTASFLAERFDLVLLPTFNVGSMVKRGGRRIRKKTVRQMLTWRHYGFRCALLHRAELTGCVVKLVSEAYTTQTCGRCGNLHKKIGGRKIFKCPHCRHQVDRDANAARNILLRNADDVGLVTY